MITSKIKEKTTIKKNMKFKKSYSSTKNIDIFQYLSIKV